MKPRDVEHELASVPGVVSVWYGPPGGPATYQRAAEATHYAASTMKLALLAALHRAAEAGTVRLDGEIEVSNQFTSAAPDGSRFACRRDYDNDEAVWDRLGQPAGLRWLAERMIVRSSNLAANLILSVVGRPAANEVWRVVGARHSVVARGIEDAAAAAAGLTNLVTAADLAALLGAIALGAETPGRTNTAQGPLAGPDACRSMLDVLLAQERSEDLAAGLPPGTRIAHKNGWIDGVRHGAGIVFPDDAPPFVLAVCATTPLSTGGRDDAACQLVAGVAAAAWTARHTVGPP
jgi:beta-lactamase class A